MEKLLKDFKSYLGIKRLAKASIKNYASDVRKFLHWHRENNLTNKDEITTQLNPENFKQYKAFLTQNNLPGKTINRHLASLRSFGEFLQKEKLLMSNPVQQLENIPLKHIIEESPQLAAQKSLGELLEQHKKTFLLTLGILALVVLALILGIVVYTRSEKKRKELEFYSQQLSQIPVPSGKLPEEGETGLEKKETDKTTDIEDTTMYPYDIESISGTGGICEYCLNARALQGYTPSASGSANKVLVIDEEGDLNLGEENPNIYAPVGNLGIGGQALTLVTNTGSDGDITLAPDGQGALYIHLSSSSGDHLSITNANISSGALINGWAANNNTGFDLFRLSSGVTEIERFSISTEGDLFLSRNATISGDLKASSLLLQGWKTNLFEVRNSSGSQLATLSNTGKLGLIDSLFHLNDTDTYLAFADDEFKINVGGASFLAFSENTTQDVLQGNYNQEDIDFRWDGDTETGTFFVDASEARVGVGTSNPGYKLHVVGNAYIEAEGYVGGNLVVGGHLLPKSDDTSDIGSSTKEWRDLYIDGTAYLDSASIGALALSGNIIMADDSWIGLGAAAGRIEFDDQTTDEVNILTASVGIGTSAPNNTIQVANLINFDNTNYQTLLGYTAGASITSGTYNTFVGYTAGFSTADGSANTASGAESLYNNTSGNSNSAFGYRALYTNSTGNSNSAFGESALRDNTTGYSNSAFGKYALYKNTEGYHNSALGLYALFANTTGNRNSAFGRNALLAETEGTENVAMGDEALVSLTTGSTNTSIGRQSGFNVITGSGNVFLGYKAGYSETGSNKLYIENSTAGPTSALIYGDFDSDILTFNGNVGIGTTTPTGPLEIDTGTDSGIAVTVDQDDVDQTALDIDVNNTEGDVVNLDWGGATTTTSDLRGIDIDMGNLTPIANPVNFIQGMRINGPSGNTTAVLTGLYVANTNWDWAIYTDDDIVTMNNLWVGATTETLDNAGFTMDGDDLFVLGTAGVEGMIYSDAGLTVGPSTVYADGTITKSTGSSLSVILGGAAGDDFIVDTNTLVVESDNDRVGIGTTTPGASLDVTGSIILGDAASDTVTFNALAASNFIADANAYDIGSASTRWVTGYFDTVNATSVVGTIVTGSTSSYDWLIGAGYTGANAQIMTLTFERGSPTINAVLQWNASGDASRVSGYDDNLLFNFPVSVYSQASGGTSTFTSGSIFNFGQNATHAFTQTGALVGLDLDLSSNITVPNSASGNQTGVFLNLADGGASATTIGFDLDGTADLGLDLSGATIGTDDIKLSNSETIDNINDSELALSDGTNTLTIDLDENSSGTIDLTTNGTVDLTFNPGGNVGIGTTSPSAKLDVIGDAYVSGTLGVGTLPVGDATLSLDKDISSGVTAVGINSNITASGSITPTAGVWGANIEAIYTSSGDISGETYGYVIGVGGLSKQNNATGKVNVLAGVFGWIDNDPTSGGANTGAIFYGDYSNLYNFDNVYGLYLPDLSSYTGAAIYTTGGDVLIGNGNVGIGTTNPGQELTVNGNASFGDGGTTNYALFNSTGDLTFYGSGDTITGPSGTTFVIAAGASRALTLTANAASTWSTSTGILTLQGDDGVNIESDGSAGIELDPYNNAVVSGGDNTDDLGTVTNIWRAGYFTTVQGGTADPLTITATATADADDLTLQTTGSAGDVLITSVDDITITYAASGGTFSLTDGTERLGIADNGTLVLGDSGAATDIDGSSVDLAGGSGSTGCTVDNSTGNLTCTGNIIGSTSGTIGYWSRSGTNLSPTTAGDDVYLGSNQLLGVNYDPSTISGGVAAFNGNVGIGTTGPSYKLEVAGDLGVTTTGGGFQVLGNASSPNILGGYSGNSMGSGAYGSSILGGGGSGMVNSIAADYRTGVVAGGQNNSLTDWGNSFIGAGYGNSISGSNVWASAIVSGQRNTITGKNENFIGGGYMNSISSSADYMGRDVIAGGSYNTTYGNGWGTIVGGQSNVAWHYGFVGGGAANTAGADGKNYATVAGGRSNTASGYSATIPGGRENTASGDYSFAAGRRAIASAEGAFTLTDATDADFTVGTTNVFGARFSGGYWLTGGNVGIGTTGPNTKLQVNGRAIIGTDSAINGGDYTLSVGQTFGLWAHSNTLSRITHNTYYDGGWKYRVDGGASIIEMADSGITFSTASSGTADSVYAREYPLTIESGADTDSLIIQSDGDVIMNGGNVGIGTTAPSSLLNLSGTNAELAIDYPGSGSDWRLQSDDSPLGLRFYIDGGGYAGDKVFFGSNGNVGIGTTTPGQKLDVNGNINVGGNNLYFGSGPSITTGGSSVLSLNATTYTHIPSGTFYVDYGSVLRGGISNDLAAYLTISGGTSGYTYFSGNVGIGDTTPDSRLDVETDAASGWAGEFFNDGNNVDRYGVKIQAGADDAAGDNRMITFYDGDGDLEGYITLDDGTLEIEQASDERLKENIVTSGTTLEDINRLRVVDFKFKQNNALQTGFIAQEVKEIFPDVVSYNPDADMYSIKPLKFVPKIIKAVQEQQGIIQNLELRTQNLEGIFSGLFNKVKTGLIETKDLMADKVVATIGQFNHVTINDKLISPLVETENLIAQSVETKMLKPIADKDLILQLSQVQSSKFKVQTKEGKDLFAVDSNGNATLAGELAAKSVYTEGLETRSASVSGELTAGTGHFKKLYADEIEGLEDKVATLTGDTINNYYYETATPDKNTSEVSEDFTSEVKDSDFLAGLSEEEIASYSALLATMEQWNNGTMNNYDYLDISSIDTDSLIVDEFLAVIGQAVITNLQVTDALTVNNNMFIADNSIGSTTDTLFLQPSGMGGINMMAGKFRINENGDVVIDGNLEVSGTINSNELKTKSLFAELIQPKDDLIIQLNQLPDNATPSSARGSKLRIEDANNNLMASIDASGSARFNDVESRQAMFRKLNIAAAEATPSAGFGTLIPEITTNATAGQAALPANETELAIYNQNITKDSLIYITPTSDTGNKVLFVKNKKDGREGFFTIGLDKAISRPIGFNWWIIN